MAACGGAKSSTMIYDYNVNDMGAQITFTYPVDAKNYKILGEGDEYPASYGEFQIRAGETFVGVDYDPNNAGSVDDYIAKFKEHNDQYAVEKLTINKRDAFSAKWEKQRSCYVYIDISDIRKGTLLQFTFFPADTDNGNILEISETEEFKNFINGIAIAKK